MKIIKRDGRAVDYNRDKIKIAIEKANKEVRDTQKASIEEIKEIIKYIEDFGKKRMLVEDIQDIIEEKLMEHGRYELAKKYIVYRYTRALVRKQNTTDESILGLIKNGNNQIIGGNLNKNIILASAQRDLIAGEVSKDLTKRILLPEKITKAHEDGVLYFHNMDYFLQPIINHSLIDIEEILENGTVINGKKVESPKSFYAACLIVSQVLQVVCCGQYGEASINIKYLGKFIKKSKEHIKNSFENICGTNCSKQAIEILVNKVLEMEISKGVETIQYQLNTLMSIKGQKPLVNLILDIGTNEEYIDENIILIEEFLNQSYNGMKNEKGEYIIQEVPNLLYVINENNCLNGGKYDYLTKKAIECVLERVELSFISYKDIGDNKKSFNQGIVSINLPQIGILADDDEEKFWELLNERLELCRESLMCRHYALLGTLSDISPLHWKYGAIERLDSGEKIDNLLKENNSTISLGYIGLYELTKIMKGMSQKEENGYDFAIKVIKKIKDTILKWKNDSNIEFSLSGFFDINVSQKFVNIDKEKFGIIKDITDKEYYTNSFQISEKSKINNIDKLKIESKFQKLHSEEAASYIVLKENEKTVEEIEEIIKIINSEGLYVKFKNDSF